MTLPSTSSKRWKRLQAIFHEALELQPDARNDFVRSAAADDTTLRREVQRLLDHDDESNVFLGATSLRPMISAAAHAVVTIDQTPDQPGTRIGRYELVERIALGGMGVVWRARRVDGAFEQEVAIKVIKRGMDTDEILHRFRHERQLLARLEHPNIANLYDGGATEDGRPYLVMEYIDGVPIDRYCHDHKLDVRACVQLFVRVCIAVHEAHKYLIVHRDLKPSNIMVSCDGIPKLLDFGIAKVLDPTPTSTAPATATSARILTPRYASPEQVQGRTITTASDVYSLGVILYELLTGCRPYDVDTDSRHELERMVVEQEPTRPSLVVMRSGTSRAATTSPTMRSERSPRRLRRLLAGDLDTIVLTALRKEPELRYGSAQQLADDLNRYIEGLPILARRTGTVARMVKAMRRHKREFAAAVFGSTVALVLALALTGYLFIVPIWVQEHVDNARLELLDPGLSNNIVIAVYQHRSHYGLNPQADIVGDALSHYDAALRWYPLRDDIRKERELVRLAAGGGSSIDESLLDDRSRGLLRMLTADVNTAVQAWSKLDFVTNPDPLAEGLLGIYYLANDEPERAYPRLTSAYKALPTAGFLCVSLAEAAARCGDGKAAFELIERAKATEEFDDGTGGAERVTALALTACGRIDEAIELYEEMLGEGYNPIMQLQYAELMKSQGRQRDALTLLARGVRLVSHWTKVNCAFMRDADVWWSNLSDAERKALIASLAHDDPADADSFSALVFAYRVASLAIERADPDAAPQCAMQAAPTLAELAAPLEIHDLIGWVRCGQRYPDDLCMRIEDELAGPNRRLSANTLEELQVEVDRKAKNSMQYYFAGM